MLKYLKEMQHTLRKCAAHLRHKIMQRLKKQVVKVFPCDRIITAKRYYRILNQSVD